MASSYIEELTCPKCHTKVRVKVTNGTRNLIDHE